MKIAYRVWWSVLVLSSIACLAVGCKSEKPDDVEVSVVEDAERELTERFCSGDGGDELCAKAGEATLAKIKCIRMMLGKYTYSCCSTTGKMSCKLLK